MGSGNCPNPEMLGDYLLGRVSEADLATIGAHIESCKVCQSRLESCEGLSDPVIQYLRHLVPDEAQSDDSLLEELSSRVEDMRLESASASHDQVRETAPPQQIGQYQLLEKLGQGSMGTVYKAFQTKLKRPVAVKLLLIYRQRPPRR